MNSRVLHSIWKLQRVGGVAQKLNGSATFVQRSYATGFKTAKQATSSVNWLEQHQQPAVRLYSAQALAPQTQSAKTFTKAEPRLPQVEWLLQQIDSNYQRSGNVSHEQLIKLLDALEQDAATVKEYNKLLSAEQALFLLGACGEQMPAAQSAAQRMQLFERLWQYLEQHKQLKTQHYVTSLEVRRFNRVPLEDWRQFVATAGADAAVDAAFYEQLVEVACEVGNIRQATEILGEMRAQQYPLTERVFNALIVGNARNGDLDGCRAVLSNMQAANVPLSSDTQTALICAYLENSACEEALKLLKQHQGTFDGAQLMRVLRSALTMNDGGDVQSQLVERLVDALPAELLDGQEVALPLRNICTELVQSGNLDAALLLINALPTPRFNDNQDRDTFAAFLLHELFRAKIDTARIIEISKMLTTSGKNERALHIATEIAARRSPPTALPLLEALAATETLRPHYFWPLLMYNFRRHGEAGVVRTLQHMKQMKVACDEETLLYYVLPRLSMTLADPQQALKALDAAGVKSSLTLTPILAHLLSQQKSDQALQLVQVYPTKLQLTQLLQPLTALAVNVRATKRYQSYFKLLQALTLKSAEPRHDFIGLLLLEIVAHATRLRADGYALQRLLNGLHKFELTISSSAAELITAQLQTQQQLQPQDLAVVERTLRAMRDHQLTLPATTTTTAAAATNSGAEGAAASSFIKHPRDMSLDELECHLIELQSKGLNTRGVLRRLLQLSVRESRLERALELKKRCDELRVQISAGMLASILDMYIKLKDLPQAEATLRRLQTEFPGFQLDEHKIIDFAALLVHDQQLDAAKFLLSERAAKCKVVGGDYVLKNVWQLLTRVAHFAATNSDLPRERNMTRETFSFLQQHNYCNAQNALLGPLVREYLLRGDVPAAVGEFERLATQYKHTPLQFELLSLLVKLSNAVTGDAVVINDISQYACDAELSKQLLTRLTEVIIKVHGVENMNSALLLAIAAEGNDQQLRRLLIDPQFSINTQLLAKNCEHLGQTGAIPTLVRLARAARGLSHIVSEHSIYSMLLQKFSKDNNCDGALELYERLELDDELKMSPEFLRNLVHLLRVNNVEIPSSVALRAQIM